jgi:hypothetical protein
MSRLLVGIPEQMMYITDVVSCLWCLENNIYQEISPPSQQDSRKHS